MDAQQRNVPREIFKFGDAATKENYYCFGFLPIRNTTQNDSIYVQFEKAIEGKMKCIYFAGQNPMVSNPNLGNVHRGLRKLDLDMLWKKFASFMLTRLNLKTESLSC